MKEKGETCKTLFFICLVVALLASVSMIINNIKYRSIDSWLGRAKDAGNPQQVAEFLANYKEALYRAGLVEGCYYNIFRYPGTYMPTYIRAVDGLINRATDLTQQSSADTSYQMGLVNLEKDLGDLEAVSAEAWLASNPMGITTFIGLWMWLGVLISGIVYLVSIL